MPPETARRVVVAADVGGTKIAAAPVDVATMRPLTAPLCAPTPARAGADAVLEVLERLVRRTTDDHGADAIGVASAGVVDPTTGGIVSATDTLTGWTGTPVGEHLRRATGLPVAVLNDVHAHALGEAVHGAGRGARSVLVVAAGTGLGASLVIERDVVVGHGGAGGHGGHVPSVEATGVICSCGAEGHLEAVASGPGLATGYERATGRRCTAAQVCDLADDGDARATAAVRTAGLALGRAVGGWLNLLDPERVVVSGGLAGAGETWWEALRGGVVREALPPVARCPVVPAGLGDAAALVGAAERARRWAR